MKKNNLKRRAVAFVFMCLMAMNIVFAATGDDFGVNEYLGKLYTFLRIIGAGMLLIALVLWAFRAPKGLSGREWMMLLSIFISGLVIMLAPNIITGLFGLDVSGISAG